MSHAEENETPIRALYQRVLHGWNIGSGQEFAAPFAEDGEVVGFDGSRSTGRAGIAEEMGRIFADHATGPMSARSGAFVCWGPRRRFFERSPA